MTAFFRVFVPTTTVVLLVSETYSLPPPLYRRLPDSPWTRGWIWFMTADSSSGPVLLTILLGYTSTICIRRFYVKSRIVLCSNSAW